MVSRQIEVVYFQRKPLNFHRSIEIIFDDIRKRLPRNFQSKTYVFTVVSRGFINRVRILFEAWHNQSDVNHVTGDIHFAVILLNKRKTILTIHDCGVLFYTSGVKRLLIKLFWFDIPLRKARYITVVSESTKLELLKQVKLDEKKIFVIPVATSPDFIHSPQKFNKRNPSILHIGTAANKNLHRLLEAVNGISCKLEVVGPVTKEIKSQILKLGLSVTFSENISHTELIKKYKECDILSFVSEIEGFGIPILEAQATGRVVVTSKISSMPEIAGEGACFVDPFDVLSIRDGIVKVIEDDTYRDLLIQNGFQNLRRFHPDEIAAQYVNLYNLIVCTN